jgi:hypothetical protein
MVDVPGRVIALFEELMTRGEQIKDICKKIYFSGGKKSIDVQAFEAWRTSCLTLLRSTFGTSSPHYDSFINLKFFDHYNSTLLYLGILQGARDDIKNGYFYHKDLMLSVNIFNSFLSRASVLSQSGDMEKAVGLLEAVTHEAMKKLAETQGCAHDASDGVMGLADALKQAGTLPAETRNALAELCVFTAAANDGGRTPAIFGEWLSWIQKFLYEYLGSRIVIVN